MKKERETPVRVLIVTTGIRGGASYHTGGVWMGSGGSIGSSTITIVELENGERYRVNGVIGKDGEYVTILKGDLKEKVSIK